MTAPHTLAGTPLRNIRIACAGACAVTSAAFAVLVVAGVHDPVAMPTTPRLVVAVAAATTAILPAIPGRGYNTHLATVATAAVVMFSGSLLALPHTFLMVVVRTGQVFTGGGGSFDVVPSWPATTAHGLNLIASSFVVLWLALEYRRRKGRCLRCGRSTAAPPVNRRRQHLRVLAIFAVIAALPYGLLKLAWSLGSDIGLTGHGFDDVTASSPGFGDTVALTGLAIVASAAMATGITKSAVRWALIMIGGAGSLMLLPVSVTAAAQLIPALWRNVSIDNSEIAPWAFGSVYGNFLIWGVMLAWLTVAYWRATRPHCRSHGPRAA